MQYLLALLFFFVCSAVPVFAQTDWVINNYQSDIAIQSDGAISVKETINVDFNSLAKHGIYRDLPVVYQDDKGEKTYTRINVTSVLQDNQTANYQVTQNDNNLRIRIGDPNRTLTGIHNYVIAYNATGVLRSFADHDELYWNVTGNAWEAAMQNVGATITLPKEKVEKTQCFEGATGSTNECSTTEQTPNSVTFHSTKTLSPYSGMTVVVGYTKGLVPILTVTRPATLMDDFQNPKTYILSLISLGIGISLLVLLWIKRGRDFWFRTPSMLDPNAKAEAKPIGAHETIVVEFTPPEALRPAEMGVLMDERADTLDITATIIDLANRGLLTISEIDKKWLFGAKDYELHKTGAATDKLLTYEKLLLGKLFAGGDTIKVSALKTKFYEDLAAVKKELYKDVVDKKLFMDNPGSTKMKYTILGIIIMVVSIFSIFQAIAFHNAALVMFCVSMVLNGGLLLYTSQYMSRRSALGHELYRRSKGYLLFIGGAEKYRQQFYEKQNMFNEILPYAIIFGLTEKFAQAMKDMGIQPTQPTWYSGTGPFIPVVFASNLNSFSRSLSTAIASTPSKSGGFSGGSVGGGFGGGGGGSW